MQTLEAYAAYLRRAEHSIMDARNPFRYIEMSGVFGPHGAFIFDRDRFNNVGFHGQLCKVEVALPGKLRCRFNR
jgi:hypothetical protein